MADPGLKSKFIEMQQAEVFDALPPRCPPTTLELDRSRVMSELNRATNPRHRQMLCAALSEIERRITIEMVSELITGSKT